MAERKPLAHPVPSGQNGCKLVFYIFDVGDQEVDEEDIERWGHFTRSECKRIDSDTCSKESPTMVQRRGWPFRT